MRSTIPKAHEDDASPKFKGPSAGGGTHRGGAKGLTLEWVDGFELTPKALEKDERRRGGQGGGLGGDGASFENVAPACEEVSARGDDAPSHIEEERAGAGIEAAAFISELCLGRPRSKL